MDWRVLREVCRLAEPEIAGRARAEVERRRMLGSEKESMVLEVINEVISVLLLDFGRSYCRCAGD